MSHEEKKKSISNIANALRCDNGMGAGAHFIFYREAGSLDVLGQLFHTHELPITKVHFIGKQLVKPTYKSGIARTAGELPTPGLEKCLHGTQKTKFIVIGKMLYEPPINANIKTIER